MGDWTSRLFPQSDSDALTCPGGGAWCGDCVGEVSIARREATDVCEPLTVDSAGAGKTCGPAQRRRTSLQGSSSTLPA